MKKLVRVLLAVLLTLTLLPAGILKVSAAGGVVINEENFPDMIFRNIVIDSTYINPNGDYYLSQDEIDNVTSLSLNEMGINSLVGIGYFASLEVLEADDNNLTSLDVSMLPNLKYLYCEGNKLTKLNLVPAITDGWYEPMKLKEVNCSDNKLASLDLSQCPDLDVLAASGNQLTSLDVSKNTKLHGLYVGDNKLTSLNLNNNTDLVNIYISNNSIKTIDISKLPNLDAFQASNNGMTSITIGPLTSLRYLDLNHNNLSSLNISQCPGLENVYVAYNSGLTSIGTIVSHGLKVLDASFCNLSSIDLFYQFDLVELNLAGNKNITSLDISNNTELLDLKIHLTGIKSMNYANNNKIKYLATTCTNEQIEYLPDLECYYNYSQNLTSCHPWECTNLRILWLDSLVIEELDIHNNVYLMSAAAYGQKATSGNYVTYTEIEGNAVKNQLHYKKDAFLFSGPYSVETPIMLTAMPNNDGTNYLSWDMPGVATYYELWYRHGTAPEFAKVDVNIIYKYYTHENVVSGKTYTYYVIPYYVADGGDVFSGPYATEQVKVKVNSTDYASITQQPSSKTVTPGTATSFSVKASGSNVKYQWWYRTSSSGKWQKSTASCATSATYSLTASQVNTARNGYQYRCAVYNDDGYMTSAAVTLTVKDSAKPTITTQPKSQTVKPGTEVKFTVGASGTSLKYQWYYRTSSSGTWNKCTTNGATTATYTVPADKVVAARNGYQYYCEVSNTAGKTDSSPATLTISSSTAKPTITTQPVSKTVKAGTEVKFTVAASGTGLKYQWYYRTSSSGTWNKCTTNGATTATYTVPADKVVTARNGYQYYCEVSNSAGKTDSKIVTLTVVTKPKITSQPVSKTVSAGTEVKFKVTATGGGLKYQWYYRTSSSGTWNKCTTNGATTATYTVPAEKVIKARSGYQYYCKITNAAGSIDSNIVTLTVK